MESTNVTNPSVQVTPISQSSVDPIITEESSNQDTTVISSSEGTTVTSAPSSDPIDQIAANLQTANASVANFAANAIEVAREGAHEIETKTVDGINYAYDFAVVSKELAGEFAVATKAKAIQSKDYLLEKAKSSKDFAFEKAVQSKEFVLEKAKSSKDFTVEKASQSKEFVAEKTIEGKDLLLEKADQSKEFAVMEYGKGKELLSSKWAASRKALLEGGRWVYSRSLQSYRFAFKKAQDGSMWVYNSLLAPFMVKSLLLTQSAAEKGKDGLSYVSTKAEELEKRIVDMPSDATDTLASMSGTPIPAETTSSLGTSQLENMSTFYSTLNQPTMGTKVAPMTGTSEEKVALIHQE